MEMQEEVIATKKSDVYAMVLGKLVAYHRERNGWTQMKFAKDIEVTQSTLSRIERGETQPDTYTFNAICEKLGKEPSELLQQVQNVLKSSQKNANKMFPKEKQAQWWETAAVVAGVAGLASLVGFAVASSMTEAEED